MKTWKDVASALKAGHKIPVQFTSEIENQETFLDEGMRGLLIGYREEDDTCLSLIVDLAPFEEYNKAFEKATYWDKTGVARLDARSAGYYPKDNRESVWVDEIANVGDVATLLDDDTLALYREYSAASPGISYVAWLEAEVRRLRAGLEATHGR